MGVEKQKYIAVLTEGGLEQEVIDALTGCGYTLKRESNYGGCITNHYVKQETDTCCICIHGEKDWSQEPCSQCGSGKIGNAEFKSYFQRVGENT